MRAGFVLTEREKKLRFRNYFKKKDSEMVSDYIIAEILPLSIYSFIKIEDQRRVKMAIIYLIGGQKKSVQVF